MAVLALVAGACDERALGYEVRPPRPDASADTALDGGDPAAPPEPWTREEPLRIATFNVERLFDTVCDSGECGGGAYEALPNPRQLALQASQLADAIAALEADIVLVQEIENETALNELFDRLRGHFVAARLAETGRPASVDVGVMANGRILRIVSHIDTPLFRPDGSETHFARDLMEVHLAMSESAMAEARTEVIVFSAHFKSKANDDPGRRLAEARAAREIVGDVAAANPGVLVVLGGDLNDTPGSEPIESLEGDGALLRVAADRPEDVVNTYVYAGRGQAIDHLFLALDGGGVYLPRTAESVWNDNRIGYGGSDHAALRADFWLRSDAPSAPKRPF